MALREARRQGITCFSLTVDEAAHNSLETLMPGMHDEILSDIRGLPVRFSQLDRRLTRGEWDRSDPPGRFGRREEGWEKEWESTES